MDITETYIKMSDCPDIQGKTKGWTGGIHVSGNIFFYVGSPYTKQQGIPDGYYYFLDETFEGEVCDKCGHKEDDRHRTIKSIWLPHQDQLQEMLIPEPYRDFRNLLAFFFDWIDWQDDDGEFTKYISMEQLWLAFVMKEKFNKTWNGEAWLNI